MSGTDFLHGGSDATIFGEAANHTLCLWLLTEESL